MRSGDGGEVRYAVDELDVNNLVDLRRRSRVGMGTCQAELCACRAAGLMNRFEVATPRQSTTQLSAFMEERWRGIEPIAWGKLFAKPNLPLGCMVVY